MIPPVPENILAALRAPCQKPLPSLRQRCAIEIDLSQRGSSARFKDDGPSFSGWLIISQIV